jgi:hypothetical protein
LIYAQLIGILLILGTYELKLLHLPDIINDPSFDHFIDIIKFNNSDSGIKLYMEILVSLSVLLSFWNLISNRTIIHLIISMVSVPFALWFWTILLPFEKLFSLNDPVFYFNQLIAKHITFGIFVWTLLGLNLLGSNLVYVWEPIELIFIHVIAGILIIDLSFDLPLINAPNAPLTLHYGHVTNAVGTALLDYVIPGLIAAFGLILVYRLYQKSILDFLLLILFGAGGFIHVTQVVPLEKELYFGGPSRTKQLKIAYAHFITLVMVIFFTSLKLTLYYGSMCYVKTPIKPQILEKSKEKSSLKEKTELSPAKKKFNNKK